MLSVQGDFGYGEAVPYAFQTNIVNRLNKHLIAVFEIRYTADAEL